MCSNKSIQNFTGGQVHLLTYIMYQCHITFRQIFCLDSLIFKVKVFSVFSNLRNFATGSSPLPALALPIAFNQHQDLISSKVEPFSKMAHHMSQRRKSLRYNFSTFHSTMSNKTSPPSSQHTGNYWSVRRSVSEIISSMISMVELRHCGSGDEMAENEAVSFLDCTPQTRKRVVRDSFIANVFQSIPLKIPLKMGQLTVIKDLLPDVFIQCQIQ